MTFFKKSSPFYGGKMNVSTKAIKAAAREIALSAACGFEDITRTYHECGIGPVAAEVLSADSGLVYLIGENAPITIEMAIRRRAESDRNLKVTHIVAENGAFLPADIPAVISQMRVGTHVASVADGVRAALRKRTNIIVIPEVHDAESIRMMGEAALTGHCVYTSISQFQAPEILRMMEDDPDLIQGIIHEEMGTYLTGLHVRRHTLRMSDEIRKSIPQDPESFEKMFWAKRVKEDGSVRKPISNEPARAAVMAALRTDLHEPLSFISEEERVPVPSGMLLVAGSVGYMNNLPIAGAIARHAERGGRTVLVSHRLFCAMNRWLVAGTVVVAPDMLHEGHFRQLSCIMVCPEEEGVDGTVFPLFEHCAEGFDAGDLMIIDLSVIPPAGHDEIMRKAKNFSDQGLQVIVTCRTTENISKQALSLASTMIAMHQEDHVNEAFKRFGELCLEQPGLSMIEALNPHEGILVSPSVMARIKPDYPPRSFMEEPLPKEATVFIARLREALGKFPSDTNTQRLEMVSRAFGHRSWHAVQGRRR